MCRICSNMTSTALTSLALNWVREVMEKWFKVWGQLDMCCFVWDPGFHRFEYAQCGGEDVLDPVAVGGQPSCAFWNLPTQNRQCLPTPTFPLLFPALRCPSPSTVTFPKLFPSFSFLKANTPCETWSTGFLEGTTATTRGARPCQTTPWQPCAAPCTKWSPRTWRMPRPYGMLAA